jgi:hypothetical protein
MTTSKSQDGTDVEGIPARPEADEVKVLSPAAQRALAEAAARRIAEEAQVLAYEEGGRNGPEPTRFGDWENKGRVTDF